MKNKIVEWILAIVFFMSLIAAVGFVEQAPAYSVVSAVVLAADVYAINHLWTDTEEDDEWNRI